MEKIKSNYLGIEFEFCIVEVELENGPKQLVSHNSLQQIIQNQIPAEYQLRYDVTFEVCTPSFCVAKCTMIDAKGRRIQEIGESQPDTLYTDIAKGIPATMAYNRAFDRAAISYLNLEGMASGRIYSKEEFDLSSSSQEKESAQKFNEENFSQGLGEEDFLMDGLDPFDEADLASNNAKSESSDFGKTIITFGRYSEKPRTIEDLCSNWKKNGKWVNWALRQTPQNDEEYRQLEALKQYVESHELN